MSDNRPTSEIVLKDNQFVRRVVQETPIGSQEHILAELLENQKEPGEWLKQPITNGDDVIDTAGMVKHIYLGSLSNRNYAVAELNYMPMARACLTQNGDDPDKWDICLKDPRRPNADGDHIPFPASDYRFFDESPLKWDILPEHNIRLFFLFSLKIGSPQLFAFRDEQPWCARGMPNSFDHGEYCTGHDFCDFREELNHKGSSALKIITELLTCFAATPSNYDLSTVNSHRLWGHWSEEGKLIPRQPALRNPHTNEAVVSFCKSVLL